MLERRLGQRPGWMLVVSRVVIAATVFVLSASDTGDPGFETEPDDLLALAYLGFSIASLVVYATNWWLAFCLRQFVFAVDFLNYVMIMLLIEPMQSGYFAASITLLAFLTLSTAVQMGVETGGDHDHSAKSTLPRNDSRDAWHGDAGRLVILAQAASLSAVDILLPDLDSRMDPTAPSFYIYMSSGT